MGGFYSDSGIVFGVMNVPRNSATLPSVWQELISSEHTMLLVLQFILCRSCSAPTLASVNCLWSRGRDKKLNESPHFDGSGL